MRVYLAGAMQGRMGWEVLAERAHATEVLEGYDLAISDPAATEIIDPEKPIDMNMDWQQMLAFVSKDEFAIRQCQCLLILTGDSASEGTGLEFGLALQLGIPVVLISPLRCANKKMGFWSIKASAIFATVEDAAEYIAENFDA